jgi:hypothetical protein
MLVINSYKPSLGQNPDRVAVRRAPPTAEPTLFIEADFLYQVEQSDEYPFFWLCHTPSVHAAQSCGKGCLPCGSFLP